jgi:hypothetical protein
MMVVTCTACTIAGAQHVRVVFLLLAPAQLHAIVHVRWWCVQARCCSTLKCAAADALLVCVQLLLLVSVQLDAVVQVR